MLKLISKKMDLPDEQLLRLLKIGDEKAFEQIYLRYWRKCFSIAYNWVKSEEIAKELVQDLFTNLWEKRESVTVYKSLSAYIHTSIKYIVFDYIDAKNVRQKYLKLYQSSANRVSNSTDEKVAFNELNELVEQGINALPEKAQVVYNLNKKENLSIKEIAEKLSISTKTVEYHLHNAKNHIRQNCKDFIVSLAVFYFLNS